MVNEGVIAPSDSVASQIPRFDWRLAVKVLQLPLAVYLNGKTKSV